MTQLAESIVRVKGIRDGSASEQVKSQTKEKKKDCASNDTQYLISFDKSIHLEDVWVTAAELKNFNEMRRDMANRQVKPRVSAEDNVLSETNTSHNLVPEFQNDDEVSIEYIKKSERLRGYDMDQLDFCHHCMQLKQT